MNASTPIESPCIKVCTLSDDERYCLGCYRTPGEIAAWSVLDDRSKQAVLDACAQRSATLDRVYSAGEAR